MAETCSAQHGSWTCCLIHDHGGLHRDGDGDYWDVPMNPEPLTEERVNNAMMVLERRIRDEMSRLMSGLGEVEKRVTALETRPVPVRLGQCPAVLYMDDGNLSGSWPCVLLTGHDGPHQDADKDWEIRTD